MEKLIIKTKKSREVIDITREVQRLVEKFGLKQGLCHLFLIHTTAAVATADLDPGTDLDMLDAFEAMVPKLRYRHPHDPEHVPEHILSTLLGPGVLLPVEGARLVLGTWQRVVLMEFSGPREREILVSAIRP